MASAASPSRSGETMAPGAPDDRLMTGPPAALSTIAALAVRSMTRSCVGSPVRRVDDVQIVDQAGVVPRRQVLDIHVLERQDPYGPGEAALSGYVPHPDVTQQHLEEDFATVGAARTWMSTSLASRSDARSPPRGGTSLPPRGIAGTDRVPPRLVPLQIFNAHAAPSRIARRTVMKRCRCTGLGPNCAKASRCAEVV